MKPFSFSDDPAMRRLSMAQPSDRDRAFATDDESTEVLRAIATHPRGRFDPVQRRRLGRFGALSIAAAGIAAGFVLTGLGATTPSVAAVLSGARSALANTSHDIVETHMSIDDGRTSSSWFDIATNASYSESYEPENGTIHEYLSWVRPDGQEVNVWLDNKWWYETPVGSVGIHAGNITAQIADDLQNGTYTVVGDPVIDGTPALELSETIQPGETHTEWVNASTYLPIKSEDATASGVLGTQTYSWEPANATNEAVFSVVIPPGFTQVTGRGKPGSAEWLGTAGSSGATGTSGNSGVAGSTGTAGNTGATGATQPSTPTG
jgi:hypothetical protein